MWSSWQSGLPIPLELRVSGAKDGIAASCSGCCGLTASGCDWNSHGLALSAYACIVQLLPAAGSFDRIDVRHQLALLQQVVPDRTLANQVGSAPLWITC
jgi:hypothetical protein